MPKGEVLPPESKPVFVNTQKGIKARLMAPWIALAEWVYNGLARFDTVRAEKFRSDVQGFVNLGTITGILTVIVVGIVILLILAALAPTYLTAVADLVNALESGTTNNTSADSLLPVFGLLVALGGVFALVGFAFLAYRRRKS